MSTEMKLIMENWRRNVLNEQETKMNTVGDLKRALLAAIQAKRKDIGKAELKKSAAGVLLSLVPGGVAAKKIYDVIRNVYTLPDDKRSNTALDHLNVDDQMSAVLDNRVENQFIKDYLKQFEKVSDDVKLGNLDMTQMLSDFIRKKYKNTKVEKA